MLIVTIDAGTTNSRVRIWRNKQKIAQASEPVGIRDTAISGNHSRLARAVGKALRRAMSGLNERYEIVASGMITSELGLYHVPHLLAPVSFNDLVQGAVAHTLPDIASQPIWFIPGVKNRVSGLNADTIDAMDMMRGEEVETVGLLMQHNISGPALLTLPGSHSKFVLTDERQRIISCVTTMAGELLDVFTRQTILSQSLDGRFAADLDQEYLLKGADSCRQVGLARSGFTVRLLDLFAHTSHNQRASYLLGAVFYSDLQAIKHSLALPLDPSFSIVVAGKPLLKHALATLIAADPFFTGTIEQADENPQRPLSSIGAIALLEKILCRSALPSLSDAGETDHE